MGASIGTFRDISLHSTILNHFNMRLNVSLHDIEAAITELSPEQLARLSHWFKDYLSQKPSLEEHSLPKRIAGLGEGTIDIPDDFDAPLPDGFWFGTE